MKLFQYHKPAPRMQRKLYLLNYLFYSVLVCLSVLLLTNTLLQSHRRDVAADMQSRLDDVYQFTEQQLDSFMRATVHIARAQWVEELAAQTETKLDYAKVSQSYLAKCMSDLVSVKSLNRQIAYMVVALYNKEYVISDLGVKTRQSFFYDSFGMDDTPQSDWLRPIRTGTNFLYVPNKVLQTPKGKTYSVYLRSMPGKNANYLGNLFVFWDDTVYHREVAKLIGNDQISLTVYDDQKQVIIGNEPVLAANAYKTLMEGEPGKGASEFTQLGASYSLYFRRSESNHWQYFIAVPSGIMDQHNLPTITVSLILTLALLLAGIPLSHFVAARNYLPIQRLTRLIASPEGSDDDGSYELLYESLHRWLNDRQALMDQMELYKPMLLNQALAGLLTGSQDVESLMLLSQTLNIQWPYRTFICVCLLQTVVVEDFNDTQLELFTRHPSTHLLCRGVVMNAMEKALICNTDEPETALVFLREVITQHPMLRWHIGISQAVHALEQLADAYEQARTCLNYQHVQSGGSIIQYSDLSTGAQPSCVSMAAIPYLYDALRYGNEADAHQAIDMLLEENTRHTLIHRDTMQILQIMLRDTFRRVAHDLQLQNAFTQDWAQLFADTGSDDAADFAKTARHLCGAFLNAREQRSRKQREAVQEGMLKWLQEHLWDASISLAALADAFTISESYASKQLKNLLGMSFLDYVNQQRIERSCAILREDTSISIAELSAQVGYTSDITFRRLFKKYMRMTPSQYRETVSGSH